MAPVQRTGRPLPPGVGLNHAACGGIFCPATIPQQDGSLRFTYQPPRELGPDWQAFDRAHEHDCLVKVPRSAATKRSRFDQSIYGIEKCVRDGEEDKGRRLRIREKIEGSQVKLDDLKKWFAAESARSPAFAKLFPKDVWQTWSDENNRRKAEKQPPIPLQLPGFAPVRAITVDASKPSYFEPQSLAAHDERGAKNPMERNVALDLYEIPPAKPGGKSKVESRPILHPRFAQMQQRWRELGVEVETPEPLPENAKFIIRVTKQKPICFPLKKTGEFAESWNDAYRRMWVCIKAINTLRKNGRINGAQLELEPAEFLNAKLDTDDQGYVIRPGSRLFGLKLKLVYKLQNESLLTLIRLNEQLRRT